MLPQPIPVDRIYTNEMINEINNVIALRFLRRPKHLT